MNDSNQAQNFDVGLEPNILCENTPRNITEECENSEKILYEKNGDTKIDNCEMTGNENTSLESNRFIEKTDANENDNESGSLLHDLQLNSEANSVDKFSTVSGGVYGNADTKASVCDDMDHLSSDRKKDLLQLDVQSPQEAKDLKLDLKQTEVLRRNRNSDSVTQEEQGKKAAASILDVNVELETTPLKRSNTDVQESNLYEITYEILNKLSVSETEHKQQSETSMEQVQKAYEEMRIEQDVCVNYKEGIQESLNIDKDVLYLNVGKNESQTKKNYTEKGGERPLDGEFVDRRRNELAVEFLVENTSTEKATKEESISYSRNDQIDNRQHDKDTDDSNLAAGNNESKMRRTSTNMSDGGSVDEERIDMRPLKLPIRSTAGNATTEHDRAICSINKQTEVSLHDKEADSLYPNIDENELKTGNNNIEMCGEGSTEELYTDVKPQQSKMEFLTEISFNEVQPSLCNDDDDDDTEIKEARLGDKYIDYKAIPASNDTDKRCGLDKHDLLAIKPRSTPQLPNDSPAMSSENHQNDQSSKEHSRAIQAEVSSTCLTVSSSLPKSLRPVGEDIEKKPTKDSLYQQSTTNMPSLLSSDCEGVQELPPSRSLSSSKDDSDSAAYQEILSNESTETVVSSPLNVQPLERHTPAPVHQVTQSNSQSTTNESTLDSRGPSRMIPSQPPLTTNPSKENNNLAPLDGSPSLETKEKQAHPEGNMSDEVAVERKAMRSPRKLLKTLSIPAGGITRQDAVFEPVSPSTSLTPLCSEEIPNGTFINLDLLEITVRGVVIAIIPGLLNPIVARYVGQISDVFPSDNTILNFLMLLVLIFAIIQVSPLSIHSFKITASVVRKLSYNFFHSPNFEVLTKNVLVSHTVITPL